MPDVPKAAVRAAAEAMQEEEDTRTYPTALTLARIALEAAAPVLAAQVRRDLHAAAQSSSMSGDHDDFLPSDIPHDVVIQEALTPFLGGFEEAEEASKAAHRALVVTYGRAIVEAEDLKGAVEVLEAVNNLWAYVSEEPELEARLRAALPPERTATDG